jgi:hypothetical protein
MTQEAATIAEMVVIALAIGCKVGIKAPFDFILFVSFK